MLLDYFTPYRAKKGNTCKADLSIGKSGYACFSSAAANRLSLNTLFITLTYFIKPGDYSVLGVRLLDNNGGDLKITKRASNSVTCAMALISDYPELIGKYKLFKTFTSDAGVRECIFKKEIK